LGMKNIGKNLIVSSLGILAILAIALVMPNDASANYWDGTPRGYNDIYHSDGGSHNYPVDNYNYSYNTRTVYYTPVSTPVYVNPVPAPTPVYVNPSPTPVVASSAANTTQTVYSSTQNPNSTVTSRTVAKSTTKKSTNTTTPTTTTVTEETTYPESDLAANAIFGSNSFLPSGIFQWILFAIMILIATILVRRVYGGNEKYNSYPLKHD